MKSVLPDAQHNVECCRSLCFVPGPLRTVQGPEIWVVLLSLEAAAAVHVAANSLSAQPTELQNDGNLFILVLQMVLILGVVGWDILSLTRDAIFRRFAGNGILLCEACVTFSLPLRVRWLMMMGMWHGFLVVIAFGLWLNQFSYIYIYMAAEDV